MARDNTARALGTAADSKLASGKETPADPIAKSSAITLNVPAGAKVRQVLLIWEGESIYPSPGDDRITVNGIGITGKLIGGPSFLRQAARDEIQKSTFQADITSLRLVAAGPTTLTLEGVTFNFRNDRAEARLILEDGTTVSETVELSQS